jgi:hypothetical protein
LFSCSQRILTMSVPGGSYYKKALYPLNSIPTFLCIMTRVVLKVYYYKTNCVPRCRTSRKCSINNNINTFSSRLISYNICTHSFCRLSSTNVNDLGCIGASLHVVHTSDRDFDLDLASVVILVSESSFTQISLNTLRNSAFFQCPMHNDK